MWESFGEFFTTVPGKVTVVMAALAVVALFGLAMRKRPVFTVRSMTRTAICVGLSVVLSFVTLFHMPQGGSVTLCSMFFITLTGYWFGPAVGIIAGVTRGFLDLAFKPYVVHPAQLALDYLFAFGILGISGFFRNQKFGLYTGFIAGVFGRFVMSTLSGIVFFAAYAGEQNVLIYSVAYNGSYMLAEMGIALVLLAIPAFRGALERMKTS